MVLHKSPYKEIFFEKEIVYYTKARNLVKHIKNFFYGNTSHPLSYYVKYLEF